jgi:hypothetical protein
MMSNQTRFNQLIDSIEGMNPKILSTRLKEMEKDGLIHRKIYHETPIRIEYLIKEEKKKKKKIIIINKIITNCISTYYLLGNRLLLLKSNNSNSKSPYLLDFLLNMNLHY